MQITRRRVLVALGGAGVAALGWLGATKGWVLGVLLRLRDNRAVAEPLPSEPGTLTDLERDAMWTICTAIAERWELPGASRPELDELLEAKTTIQPSYLASYRAAIAWLREAGLDRDPQGALTQLFAAPRGPLFQPSPADRHRGLVIGELANFQLQRGGIQTFGITNFHGAFGGNNGYRKARHEG